MKKCPNCGKVSKSKFCPECGTDLSSVDELRVCPNCGKETNSKFCPECGTEVKPYSEVADELKEIIVAEPESATTGPDNGKTENKTATAFSKVQVAANASGKKKNKKVLIGAAIAAVLILVLALGMGGNDSSTTTSETSSTTTEEEPVAETPVEEPEPEPEPEEETTDLNNIFGEFTTEEDYKGLDYDSIARKPDDYEGIKFKGSGKVLQVLESDTEVDMRVATSSDGWDDVVYLVYDPSIVDSRILEDDNVTFYGESKGLYSYESTMGGTITIPIFYVQKISID